MPNIRQLPRRYFALLLATATPAVCALIFIPIITNNVPLGDYGIYSAVQSMILVLNLLAGLSSAGYISNAYIRKHDRAKVYSSMLSALAATIPIVIIASILADYFFLKEGPLVTGMMVFCAAATYVISAYSSYLILSKNYKLLLAIGLLQLTVQYGITLGFAYQGSLTSTWLVFALATGTSCSALFCLLASPGLRVSPKLRFEKDEIKAIFAYGLPLVFHFFLALTISTFDRWYLSYADKASTLAQYSVALTLAGAISMALDVLNKIYSPKVFDLLLNSPSVTVKHFQLHLIFVCASVMSGALLFFVGGEYIRHFLNDDYAAVSQYFAPMLFANWFFLLYYLAAPYIYFHNKTRFILYSSAIGAIFVTSLLYVFYKSEKIDAISLIYIKGAGFAVMGLSALVFAKTVLNKSLQA